MSVIKSILRESVSLAYGAARGMGKRCVAAALGLTLVLPLSVGPAGAEAIRLVALGDSLTQGYGLPSDDGFVPQLQRWLDEQGVKVEVVNAGVSGDTTAGGLARMDWTLAEPVDAMIVTLGGNDLLRGIDPAASHANLDGILTRLGDEGIPALLIGMPAPGNYGPEFRAAFEGMYAELAENHQVPLIPNFLQPMSDKAEAGVSFAQLMQDDHIHPNAEGVALIVEGLGPQIAAFLGMFSGNAP